MNLIDYNKAVEALEKERQYLLNREQYEAENVLVHHALNVIAEMPIIRQPEIVRCADCKYRSYYCTEDVNGETLYNCHHPCANSVPKPSEWFCADGVKKYDRN